MTIAIDDSWLAKQQPPYVLDVPGGLYRMAVDVTCPGTAFVFGAPDVVLDLNGHTITFNDAPPLPHVGEDGWDFSRAPAKWAPAAPYRLLGDRCIEVSGFGDDGPVSLISPPVAVCEPLRCYTASVTASTLDIKADQPASRACDVRVDVLDERGALLPVMRVYQGAGGFGEGGYCSFVPDRAMSVRLKVTLYPGSGVGPVACALNRAVVSRSNDFGILCTGTDANSLSAENGYTYQTVIGGVKGYPTAIANLSPQAAAAYQSCRAPTILGNGGSIRQGRGNGQFCAAIFAVNCRGHVRIRGVETDISGDDGQGIDASSGVDNPAADDYREIVGNTLRFRVKSITARGNEYCAINVVNGGPALVQNNCVIDNPQCGIKLGALHYSHRAIGNALMPNTLITNGYGILAKGCYVTVCGNSIVAPVGRSSRGIVCENWSSTPYENIAIYRNYVDVSEAPNREYGPFAVARAFRLRNTSSNSRAAIRRVYVHDNTFIARAADGGQRDAIAMRLNLENHDGTMDDAGILVVNNRIAAVADDSASDRAVLVALSIDECYENIHPVFVDNRLESPDCCLRLGGDDGGGADVADILLLGTVFVRPDDAIYRDRPVVVPFPNQSIANVRLTFPTLGENVAALFGVAGPPPGVLLD